MDQAKERFDSVFTSGKIKGMMQHIDGVVENMINYLHKKIETDPVVDMRPVFKYLTMDTISKCAFGVDLNCFEDPENPMLVNSINAFVDFQASNAKQSAMRSFELLLVLLLLSLLPLLLLLLLLCLLSFVLVAVVHVDIVLGF